MLSLKRNGAPFLWNGCAVLAEYARLVDEYGSAVILKNNIPRYLVIDFSKAEQETTASEEDVLSISKRLMEQNKEAYEVLAK